MSNIDFSDIDEPCVEVLTPPVSMVFTPLDMELLSYSECEEVTCVYPPGFLKDLLRKATPRRRASTRSIKAIVNEVLDECDRLVDELHQ